MDMLVIGVAALNGFLSYRLTMASEKQSYLVIANCGMTVFIAVALAGRILSQY
jgi:hypothetical protein